MTDQSSPSQDIEVDAKARRRLPLAMALFLILFLQAFVAIGLMSGLGAHNLNQGFKDYLLSRDEESLDAFGKLAGERIAEAGSVEVFLESPGAMRGLVDTIMAEQGLRAPSRPKRDFEPFPGLVEAAPKDKLAQALPDDKPKKPKRRPEWFAARIALFSVDGEQIAGFPFTKTHGSLERPILVDGKTVALARLSGRRISADVEQRFLRRQSNAILMTGISLIVIAGLLAWVVAQSWVRPLLAMRAGTTKIANGKLDARLSVAGPREIAATIVNINNMAANLEKLETDRRDWLAQVSHELRTPVTILRAELESMLDGVRPFQREAATSLHEEVIALSRLIDDLNLITLGNSGKIDHVRETTKANDLMSAAAKRFEPLVAAAGLDFRVTIDPELSALELETDIARVGQIFATILTNSIRYTSAPGSVEMSLSATAEKVSFHVDDSAPGVSDEDLPALFETFFRTDTSRSKSTGGTGLGLAVARVITLALGGSIVASHSKLGGVRIGVTFCRKKGHSSL